MRKTESCNDVTIGSLDVTEIFELIELYIQFQIAVFIEGNYSELYQDDGLISLITGNRQKLDQTEKSAIKYLKMLVQVRN